LRNPPSGGLQHVSPLADSLEATELSKGYLRMIAGQRGCFQAVESTRTGTMFSSEFIIICFGRFRWLGNERVGAGFFGSGRWLFPNSIIRHLQWQAGSNDAILEEWQSKPD
jgi:hypothetical protein